MIERVNVYGKREADVSWHYQTGQGQFKSKGKKEERITLKK